MNIFLICTLLFRVLEYNLGDPARFNLVMVYVCGSHLLFYVCNFMLPIQIADCVAVVADRFAMHVHQLSCSNDVSDDAVAHIQ